MAHEADVIVTVSGKNPGRVMLRVFQFPGLAVRAALGQVLEELVNGFLVKEGLLADLAKRRRVS